jgi:hypothetical protein
MERLLRGVEPEARSRELTQAEKAQSFLEEQLAKITSKERARRLSMTAFGGADSGIPGGMGAVDFVPFLGSAKGLEEGGRDISQGNYDLESGRYGDAARNYGAAVLGVLPGAAGAVKVAPGLAKAIKATPLDEAGALTKPLTKKQFEKQFAQHIDIRGRENKNQEDNMRAILEEGFRRGFGPNAVPPYAGGAPLNIMSERFRPQSGDVVYLAPQNAWQKTPNGMQIADGWKPEPEHIVKVQDPNQSMYEAYLANFNKSKSALTREALQDEPKKGKVAPGLAKAIEAATQVRHQTTKGAQDILPALERDANLTQFLEPSKIKQRVYHGTRTSFDEFKHGKGKDTDFGRFGRGYYFTPDADLASAYTRNETGGNVMPVYLSIKNPYMFKGSESQELLRKLGGGPEPKDMSSEEGKRWAEAVREGLEAMGHDGYMDATDSKYAKEIVAFYPNQIKSALGNRGTYDINDPDINKAAGGAVQKDVGGLAKKGKAKKKPEGALPKVTQ